MATQASPYITPEEYLKRERAAEFRSEYFHGQVFSMAGASEAHNIIVFNLGAEIRNHLRGKDCKGCSNDMRLWIEASGFYTYPDVAAVCGKPIFADQHMDMLTNPVLIIEVLSDSTEDYDRGGKFHHYMRIPSLKEYLTVSQKEMLVDYHSLQADGSWNVREIRPANGKAPLRSIDLELNFADIYDKVEFPPVKN